MPAALPSEAGARASPDGTCGQENQRAPRARYCDACNRACVLMNASLYKLQPRYEGYVFLKRISSDWSRAMGAWPCLSYGALSSRRCQRSPLQGGQTSTCRRHSCDDLLGEVDAAPAQESMPARSLSQGPAEWHLQEEDLLGGPRVVGREKLVNLGGETPRLRGPEAPRRTRRQFAMSRLGCGGHPRLTRKKSRSQENLRGRGFRRGGHAHAVPSKGRPQEALNNNATLPGPASPSLMRSALSRSESSIYNVHVVASAEEAEEGAVGGLRAEVGELARLPKRLLTRVTGEVSQFIFEMDRWKEAYVVLTEGGIATKTADGRLDPAMSYSQILDVQGILPCSVSSHRCYLRIVSSNGLLFMQANNQYIRDQWLHSILWKKNSYKYRNLLRQAKRPEVMLKEMKNLVDLSLSVPLYDNFVCQVPLEVASAILTTGEPCLSRQMREEVIVTLAPLLEKHQPTPEICRFFSKHCTDNPRSGIVIDMFSPVVTRILKHNVDFGKYPHLRRFVQNYIEALDCQNEGLRVVQRFARDLHGPTSMCPHLRVLPNLVSVCITAVCFLLDQRRNYNNNINVLKMDDYERHIVCYNSILVLISEYDDWRPSLAQLLQPIPFPQSSLIDESFMKQLIPVIERIGTDPRCEVHQMVLSTRDNREGWLQLMCPASLSCFDDGLCWTALLQTLITCCCKRKRFLGMLAKSLGACMLMALRGNTTAQEILCLLLEWELIEGSDLCLEVINSLQSTDEGKKRYQALCERQLDLREIQQKGGPRKLVLPCWSTDEDLKGLLSSGSFGNLEHLSLAFTRVTSTCAEHLIKLPSLRYLNLWATQFGDTGLQIISEHLHKLQVLNLCETPVTDKGLIWLSGLKKLRKLNLNSTGLSVSTFDALKEKLPGLEEADVRYTDAW